MATIIAADAAAAVLFASTSLTRVTLDSDVRVASVHDLIKHASISTHTYKVRLDEFFTKFTQKCIQVALSCLLILTP
jgi:hypothetical protein